MMPAAKKVLVVSGKRKPQLQRPLLERGKDGYE